jgi:hypothetical protein
MVEVANRIWLEWRDRGELVKDPRIDLLLSSNLAPREALDALTEALGAAVAELDPGEELPDGYDEPLVGECRVAILGDGVVLQVYDSDMLRLLLELIATGLERRGVEGRLDVYEPKVVPPPPMKIALVECRMRVRGERHHLRRWVHEWKIDADAFRAVVAAGARWCTSLPGSLALSIDTIPRVTVDAQDDLAELLRGAVERTGVVCDLTSASPDRYRTMAFTPRDGRVTLIEAGEAIERDGGWREPLREHTKFLECNAPQLVYAYIKHGSNWGHAKHASTLMWDWPHRSGGDRGEGWFEDTHIPDAFAIQLLGPGHAGRVQPTSSWRQTQLENGAVILEHTDLPAWFDTPFAPFGGMNHPSQAFEPPEVLARAREDLKPVLFRDEIAFGQDPRAPTGQT